jgi:hypothetical protein
MAVALPDSTPRAQKSSHTVPEPQKSTTTADNLPATTNNKPAVSVVHTPKPVVTSSAVSPPQTVNPVTTTTSQSPPTSLEAAKERYLKAFEIYTKLVTTGGAGNVEEALKEYKESYAIYKKLKDQKNKN